MFIIYDCAAGFLVALIGGTLLFTAGVMCVMLMEAGGIAWATTRQPIGQIRKR